MGWKQMTADAVIYGAGVQGMAAAAKFLADTKRAGKTLCIIDPEVPRGTNGMDGIGTIATLGGQNYWDCRLVDQKDPNKKVSYQGGTFRDLFGYYQKYNNTLAFRNALLQYVTDADGNEGARVTFLHQMDLKEVTIDDNDKITSVYLESVAREKSENGDGAVQFSHLETITLNGKVFIDASESGKLSRMAQKNVPPHKDSTAVTTGRYDWDSGLLMSSEVLGDGIGRQQAVTLMVKLKGIDKSAIQNAGVSAQMDVVEGDGGVFGLDAFASPYTEAAGKIAAFNKAHASEGYMIKPFNAAMNGLQEGFADIDQEWWFNTFLVFHVDGRAYERDKGTDLYPTVKFGYKNVDEAWKDARQFLKDHESEFLNALKDWTGLTLGNSNLAFVKDEYGYPEVGDILYVRETCHTSNQNTNTTNGGEETSYHVAWWESINAGTGSDNGGDTGNYAHRIGLVWYNPDIHPYTPGDLKDVNGNYIWGYDSFRRMRDMNKTEMSDVSPDNPMYYPYEGILNYQVSNLLVPGYAANCCSFSWGEVRVLSNLCVLGDAAGLAAGYCVRSTDNLQPRDIALYPAHMAELQNSLRSYEIPLEKGKENAIVREETTAAAAASVQAAGASYAALSPGVPSYVTNGLMGLYYNIGENKSRNSASDKMKVYDKSGNGRDLTLHGGSQMNGTDSGWVKNALRCSRNYPTTTLRYTMPSNIYTMEVLIKRKNMPEAEQKPISCAEFDSDIKVTKGFTFGQDWTANSTEFSVSFAGKRFVVVPGSAGKYPFDEVVSVSVTFNPSDKCFYCYINGAFLGKVAASGHIPTNQFRLGNFGMNRDGGYACFTGDIYCARIYSRYLSQNEVLENYYRDREIMRNLVSDDVLFSLDFDSFTDTSNHENTVTNNSAGTIPTGSILNGAGYLPIIDRAGDFTKASANETISTFKYCQWTGSSSFAFSGDFTMECWVYPTGESMSLSRAGLFMTSSSSGAHSFGLGLYRTGELSFEGEFSGSGKMKLVSGAGEVPLGRWSHVAAVRSGNNLILYVNGRKVAEKTVSGERVKYSDEGDFFIGRAGNYGSFASIIAATKFYGYIGNLNFYDYAKYTKDFSKLIAPCLDGRNTYRMRKI